MSTGEAKNLLGVRIDRKSLQHATAEVLTAIDRRGPQVVFACANPHALVTAQTDHLFERALNGASLVVADGVGVSIMARVAGVEIGPRITGSDFFLSVTQALQRRGQGRVFFFGSTAGVLDLIARRLGQEFPALTLCGVLSPPFGSWSDRENADMVARINDAAPDVLWVGMTAPKQEKWVEANRRQLNAPVIGSVGAVFDFYAGTHPRAPAWMCKAGVEWLYRLAREPRRMWRRNFVSTPRFVALVLRRHVFRIGI